MVIWCTGLSGAGKTTLSAALYDLLKARLPQTVLVDGDTVRRTFAQTFGYSEPDRRTHIERVQRLAKFLADQELIVIVAALYCHPELTEWNRNNLKEYFEVYLRASDTLLRRRDKKSLYSGADSGEIANVVGVDIPWHAPQEPHMVIDADDERPPADLVSQILAANRPLREAFEAASPLKAR